MEGPLRDASFIKPEKKYDILVENLSKSYGNNVVLRNLSMHVEHGIVYGLLGSSGSGKTTLLSCLLNLKTWDSGEVFVLGKQVQKGRDIDTRNIGYMNQDLALYDQLKVGEMMRFISRLHGMSESEFKERQKFLGNLVNLPRAHTQIIGNLSGGQKRRVSLSLALIHNPKLLILDEPTVGLDPVIRERLWNYLYNLTITNKTTICITTHYIDEVKRANKVGIMRKNRLVIEEDPMVLMKAYNTVILDQAVRHICYKDEQDHGINSLLNNSNLIFGNKKEKLDLDPVHLIQISRKESFKTCFMLDDKSSRDYERSETHITNHLSPVEYSKKLQYNCSMKASVQRSLAYFRILWILFVRHPVFIFGVLLLPPLQLFTTGFVFGVEPKFVPLGVINNEVPRWERECAERLTFGSSDSAANGSYDECRPIMLSCDYIEELSEGNFIKPVEFKTRLEALHAVQQGDASGYIEIPGNFSERIFERAALLRFATKEIVDGSTIPIHMDRADFITFFVVTTQLYQSFSKFVKKVTSVCDFDLVFVDVPFDYKEPVFGTWDQSARDYIIPAIIAGILFEISFGLTPLILINDLKCGTFERSKVAGLRFIELMCGLILSMGTLAFLQGLICYLSLEFGMNFKVHGNIVTYFVLCFMAALCGGTFGLLVGVICRDEMAVIITGTALLPVIMVHVGILRPEEVLPHHYRSVVYYAFPSAAIVRAFRFVMNRGVGLLHPQVWTSIGITAGWSAVFSLLSLIVFKRA